MNESRILAIGGALVLVLGGCGKSEPPPAPKAEAPQEMIVKIGHAAPLIGGIFTSFVLELLIYPPIYQLWKWHSELKPEMESPVPVLSENLERGV